MCEARVVNFYFFGACGDWNLEWLNLCLGLGLEEVWGQYKFELWMVYKMFVEIPMRTWTTLVVYLITLSTCIDIVKFGTLLWVELRVVNWIVVNIVLLRSSSYWLEFVVAYWENFWVSLWWLKFIEIVTFLEFTLSPILLPVLLTGVNLRVLKWMKDIKAW